MTFKHFFNITLFVCVFLTFNQGVSQRFYIPIQISTNGSIASQSITYKNSFFASQSSQTVVKGSFGKGLAANVGIGYNYDSIVSLELNLSALKGAKFNGLIVIDSFSTDRMEISAWMIRLSPTLKLKVNNCKIKPYLKIFPIIKIGGNISYNIMSTNLKENTTISITRKFYRGLSLGAGASIGGQKEISNRCLLFCELSLNCQSWAPNKSDVIKYTVNGEDQLPSLNSSYKHTHYSNTINTSTFSAYNPSNQLKQYHTFSSIGIGIGLIINLNKAY